MTVLPVPTKTARSHSDIKGRRPFDVPAVFIHSYYSNTTSWFIVSNLIAREGIQFPSDHLKNQFLSSDLVCVFCFLQAFCNFCPNLSKNKTKEGNGGP